MDPLWISQLSLQNTCSPRHWHVFAWFYPQTVGDNPIYPLLNLTMEIHWLTERTWWFPIFTRGVQRVCQPKASINDHVSICFIAKVIIVWTHFMGKPLVSYVPDFLLSCSQCFCHWSSTQAVCRLTWNRQSSAGLLWLKVARGRSPLWNGTLVEADAGQGRRRSSWSSASWSLLEFPVLRAVNKLQTIVSWNHQPTHHHGLRLPLQCHLQISKRWVGRCCGWSPVWSIIELYGYRD